MCCYKANHFLDFMDVEDTAHVSVLNVIEKHAITRIVNLIFKNQEVFPEKNLYSLKTIELYKFLLDPVIEEQHHITLRAGSATKPHLHQPYF